MIDRTGQVWELDQGRAIMLIVGPPRRYNEVYAQHDAVNLLDGEPRYVYETDEDPLEGWKSPRRLA